jgi:hypothetical protein
MGSQQLDYHVDVVLVIDATASMTPIVDAVRGAALGFHARLDAVLAGQTKHVDVLRVRAVVFRDLRDNGDDALAASPFFTLPDEQPAFAAWVGGITLMGNTTLAESGLAGLSVAIHSPWTSKGDKRRHVIVLWSDDEPHAPEAEAGLAPAAFRSQVADNFDALTDLWESGQRVGSSSKRLVLFTPETGLWPVIAESWDQVIHRPSEAGAGLSDYEMDEILMTIAASI